MSQQQLHFPITSSVVHSGNWLHPAPLIIVVLAFAFLISACTVTTSTPAAAPESGATQADSQANSLPVADTGLPDEIIGDNVPADISNLDPNAIVAAQEQVFSGIYERSVPSVVRIRSVRAIDQITGLPDLPDFEYSGGSGFVWDDQGRIVTNHHVVNGAERVTVIFADHTELDAEVLGSDPDSDLAVLQVEATEHPMPAIEIGDSSAVKVGHLAVAIGNPFGQEFTITSGIISAVGRTIRTGNSQFSIPQVIQTDAPINPGNSGGPLLDRRGRVIGVNTQIISNTGANSGIGFAVPINTAKRVVPFLIEDGIYEYAWLGISGTTLTGDTAEMMQLPRDTKGALVIEVAEGGPADEGGIQSSDTTRTEEGIEYRLGGDVIITINGDSIADMDQLITYLIENTKPGDAAEIEVIRDGGATETLTVTLGKRPGL